jgi:hypothetical protein
MANYIGKIAAVGTINMAQFSRGLDNSAKDVDRFAKRISSTLSSANSAAARSFDQIFTPIQRLERAIQARSRDRLNIDTGGAEARIRALVGAAEDIARPLGSSAKAFSGLSATIQNEFIGSLVRAQNAATTAQNNITRGAIKNAQDYERYKRVVDETVISIRRLSEAGAAVSGLAGGQELRFQQAGLQAELQRAAAIQGQAGSLPASARSSYGNEIARIVALQQREAEEAARLLAILENIRNTRSEDYAAIARAQGALDGQVQRLGEVNSQLERQTRLVAELQALTSAGPRGNELIFTNPGVARELRSSAALRQAASETADPSRFSGLLAQLNQAEDLVAQYQLEVQQRPRLGVDADDAIRRLEQARETARRVREEIESGIEEQNQGRFRTLPGNPEGEFGPPAPFSTRDPTGRTIRQRAADIASERERRRLFLPGNPEGEFGPPSPFAARRDAAARSLGSDIQSAAAAFSRLESATVSVQSQIDQLPNAIRSRFVPAIQSARDELLRLAATDASPEELERATQRVTQLRQEIGRAERAFNAFGGSFRDFADASDIQRAAGRLSALRQQLARATGDTTQAEAAADRYAATLQQAANTQGGFRRLAAEINRVEQSAVNATAAVSGISVRRLTENLNRAGDVGRGAFGNSGLAIQQAAFAVDDFFSVTGGIEQRLRAVGNNISQLGFVIGGTYGLIAGISASVGAQAIAFLIKWANSGRTAELQTSALNEALEQQQSLVERLASAFANASSKISTRGFSQAGQAAAELADQLREIANLQSQVSEGGLSATSSAVRDRRTDIGLIEERLKNEANVGRRVALQRQLEELRNVGQDTTRRFREGRTAGLDLPSGPLNQDFERRRRAPITAGSVPTGQELVSIFEDVANVADQLRESRQGIRRSVDFLSGSTDVEFRVAAERLREFARSIDLGTTGEAIRSQADALEEAIDLFKGTTSRTLAGFSTDAANESAEIVRVFEELRQRILVGFQSETTRAVSDAFSAADAASKRVEEAQRSVEESISNGIASARPLASDLDAISQSIKDSLTEINNALAGVDSQGREVRRTPSEIRGVVDREFARIRDLSPRIDQAAGSVRSAEAIDSLLAPLREIVKETREASDRAVSDAQRRVLQVPDSTGRPLADLQRERDRAQSDVSASESRLRRLQSQLGFAQSGAARNPEVADLTARIEAVRQASEQATRTASATGGRQDIARALQLEAEQVALEQRRAEVIQRLTATTRAAVEAEQRLEQERARQADVQRLFREQNQPQGDGARGIDLLGGDPRRSAVQAFQQLADIETAFRDLRGIVPDRNLEQLRGEARRRAIEDVNPAGITQSREQERRIADAIGAANEQALLFQRAGDQRAAQQSIENTRLALSQQFAPDLAALAQEVRNSIAVGPSRAALQASDASTLQGQQELNRLMRGDDSAAAANIAELQRQTSVLNQIDAGIDELQKRIGTAN